MMVNNLSMLKGIEGYDSLYSLSEFTDELDFDLSSRKYKHGRVFWTRERNDEETEYDDHQLHHYNSLDLDHGRGIKERIKSVMGAMATGPSWWGQYVIQFWAAKLDGRHRYLTTWDQPFSVGNLHKGLCWYRKWCMDRHCVVEEGGGQEERLGAIGRVFVNKHPESTPDLRLYSVQEFPSREVAAGCGLRAYFAIPVFDGVDGECYGVLELTSFGAPNFDHIFALDRGLKVAKLRSTHIDFVPISRNNKSMPMENEISKMLELAIRAVPQLHLAQVWVPCKQCANYTSNNISCMERATFVSTKDAENIDSHMFEYLQACEFHNLQIGKGITRALMSSDSKSCICKNLCDFGVSENPLVHYAQKARLSLYLALCLESLHDCNDNIYVFEFFFQPNCRQEASGTSSFLHLLLRIMETELKSFKFAMEGQFGAELRVSLSQPNAVERDLFLEQYGERYSEHDFTNYLQATDLCCLRPSKEYSHGWVFCSPDLVPNLVKEKIELFMIEIASKFSRDSNCLVQFWAPKMNKDRCYLATSDQPYALGCLSKGLALFRKQCSNHCYFVDKRSKEEEVGPPGRVFRNEYPETTPDLHLYTTSEFSLRNYASHCCLRTYSALPVFDLDQRKWVGVLEFIEFSDVALQDIGKALKAVGMSSTNIDFNPSFQESQLLYSVADQSWELALAEVKDTLQLLTNVPQLYTAEVWVPYGECALINSNVNCMELVDSTDNIESDLLRHRILHVRTGNGIIGMALASENKSSFCRNSCDVSIAEHPLAHYAQQARLDVSFAICLQSSHTGNHLYVLQFFLNQGPSNYEYFCSLLSFILSILKQKLKSFKLASGQQLEEGLVIDVVEFSEANFSKVDQTEKFPFKFRTVQYGLKGQQEVQCVSDAMDSVTSAAKVKRCYKAAANNSKKNAAKQTDKCTRKTGLHLTLEHLKPHFGKKLKDVVEDLGVGRSTIKRACREYDIRRWPCNGKYKKNHAFYETESACETAQDSILNVSTTQQLIVQPEADIIVKAKHGDDIIKFQLSLSSGMDKIVEEVATRLNLLTGSFKLKYLDEDNDQILLAHDTDLQLCQKSLTAMGKTFLELFVQLIHK